MVLFGNRWSIFTNSPAQGFNMSCIWLILDRESNIAEDEVYFPIDSQVNWHHFYFKERRIKNQVFTFKEAGSGEILVDEVYQISETFDLIRQLLLFIFTPRPSNRPIWQATFWKVDIWWEIENFQTHTLGKEKGLERLRVQVGNQILPKIKHMSIYPIKVYNVYFMNWIQTSSWLDIA